LDGTLVDSLPGIAASLNRVLEAAGVAAYPVETVRGFVGNGVAMLVRRALPAGASDEQVASLARGFRADYGARWAEGSWVYPGVTEVLAELAGRVPLAVWSNKPHPFTIAMVAGLLPGIPFAAVLGEREGFPRKPDPVCAHELAAALGEPPERIALVGDSVTDMESARNAGFRSVAVTWGYHDREQLAAARPDGWVERPDQLPGLVGGLG
jgi:phosphoglycolate phosphatase